ncbi:MAG: aspartate dehydrogenase [Variibacter sp.]|nr:aspartate dehydrogenase [Variibacter sp.]
MRPGQKPLRIGLAGFGAVGQQVARRLAAGIEGLALAAIAVRDADKAKRHLRALGLDVPIVPLAELPAHCDVVVEGLPRAAFLEIARATVEAGRIFMPLSVGQLLEHWSLVERAKETGARILVPTGALIGLDAVRAAAEGDIRSVTMITRKPPGGLEGAPYLAEHGIAMDAITTPTKIFDGSAREGARGFPANVNVAAALSLAGIGPDRTRLQIWADPTIDRNMHAIEVDADTARFSMAIENVPSAENPRTGKITALSAVAALRGLVSTLKVGT